MNVNLSFGKEWVIGTDFGEVHLGHGVGDADRLFHDVTQIARQFHWPATAIFFSLLVIFRSSRRFCFQRPPQRSFNVERWTTHGGPCQSHHNTCHWEYWRFVNQLHWFKIWFRLKCLSVSGIEFDVDWITFPNYWKDSRKIHSKKNLIKFFILSDHECLPGGVVS